jgi:hypothetical protein
MTIEFDKGTDTHPERFQLPAAAQIWQIDDEAGSHNIGTQLQ